MGRPRSVSDLLLPPGPLATLDTAATAVDPLAAAFATLRRQQAEAEAVAAAERRARAAPSDPAAWLKLGELLARADRRAEALEAYRHCQALVPERREIDHLIAALGGDPAPTRASDAYVANVFDGMAERFEETLVGFLDYRAPQILADLAQRLEPGSRLLDIADLGCGTGLMAPLLRPRARRLAGIDLSAGMLQRAAGRKLYDVLAQAEIGGWLRAHPDSLDLAAAADVLCYFGELDEVLAAVAGALRHGGLLVFSVERQDRAPWLLSASGRYAHRDDYVRQAVAQAELGLEALEPVALRTEKGKPVDGYAVAARKPA